MVATEKGEEVVSRISLRKVFTASSMKAATGAGHCEPPIIMFVMSFLAQSITAVMLP